MPVEIRDTKTAIRRLLLQEILCLRLLPPAVGRRQYRLFSDGDGDPKAHPLSNQDTAHPTRYSPQTLNSQLSELCEYGPEYLNSDLLPAVNQEWISIYSSSTLFTAFPTQPSVYSLCYTHIQFIAYTLFSIPGICYPLSIPLYSAFCAGYSLYHHQRQIALFHTLYEYLH